MKLLAATSVPLSSLLISVADAAVYRLRGHSGNHALIEHHTHNTKTANCDDDCQIAHFFGVDMCTYDFNSLTCSGCSECQTEPAPLPPTIRYKSLKYTGGRLDLGNPNAFVNAIKQSASAPGYCEQDLTEASWKNEHTCSGGSIHNVAFEISVDFDNHIGSTWHFNFGVDFGLGGVIYMNGTKMKSYAGDIWWSMQEGHANELGFSTFLPKGRHSMKVYGAEGCCDGPSRIKFCANCETESNMELLSISNIEKAADHFMEMGNFSAANGDQFHAFDAAFETPPVVVISGGANGQIQVSQVTDTGFSTKGASGTATLKYLAVEAGSHLLPDGRTIEAGQTVWSPPYSGSHTFSFQHNFGVSAPAFEVTWVASAMESSGPPSVTSQLSSTGASLSVVQPGQQPNVQLSAAHRVIDTLGYVAMAKGAGQVKAQGDKDVDYDVMLNLFNWTLDSFVI